MGAGRWGGNFPVLLWWLSVCQVSLDKNHIGLGGTGGIHRAILMNCTAQASLNSASEAEFSLPIRCGFYQVRLRRSLRLHKSTGKFPPHLPAPISRQAWCIKTESIFHPVGGNNGGGGLSLGHGLCYSLLIVKSYDTSAAPVHFPTGPVFLPPGAHQLSERRICSQRGCVCHFRNP